MAKKNKDAEIEAEGIREDLSGASEGDSNEPVYTEGADEGDAPHATKPDKDKEPSDPAPTLRVPTARNFPEKATYRLKPGFKHHVVRKNEDGELVPVPLATGDTVELSAHQAHAFRDRFEKV
jgi:hypothetical protein